MTIFILIALIITVAVLIVLIRPLLRQNYQNGDDRQAHNIHYAKQRLAELQQQRDAGKLNDMDLQALKNEIEVILAQDIDLDDQPIVNVVTNTSNSNPILIAALCTLLPIGALLIYWIVGSPQSLNESNQQSNQSIAIGNATPSNSEIQEMIVELRQSLDEQPDNAEGWGLLARTLMATGQYPESIEANKKLLELSGENSDIYAALADASAILADGKLQGQPLQYVEHALELDPEHPQSLWLAGLAAAQQGNNESARSYWNTLLPLLADLPQQQNELAEIIEQSTNEVIAPKETEEIKPPKDKSGISILVSLSKGIKLETQDNEAVFVFAKAQQGPPAPLAVKRLKVKDLPIQIQLSDADAMLPQFTLSKFDDIIISARVSKSGQPTAQVGDLQSASILTTNNDPKRIEVVIDKIVE